MPEYKQAPAILDAIAKADSIVIFRHVNPDPDALGSQLGMKEAILSVYPEKTVLALGSGEGMDAADDSVIEHSLAIITDTSNAARIDDARYALAPQTIRFDHHVKVEDFGPLDLVDEKAAAACELEALFMKDAGWTISKEAAQNLMKGLMADTQRFTIPTVSARSFEAAAWLMEMGADPNKAAADLFSNPYAVYEFVTRIREKTVRQNNFLFALISEADYLGAGVAYEQAKNHVYAMNNIDEIEIWTLFTEQPDHRYAASLRSKKISVREIAAEFGGGGHVCACGIKDLDGRQISEIIERLSSLSLEKPEQE